MGHTTARKETETPADPWMGLREAARELKTTRQTVLSRIVAKELDGMQVAGRIVVSRESVERAKKAK